MTEEELKFIENSINIIKQGITCKIEHSNKKIKVYKVPSNNSDKYVIRIDVKVGK